MLFTVALIACALFLLGYLFYGRLLAKWLDLNASRTTPACAINDGVDFVPAKAPLLLGQHFSAIAARFGGRVPEGHTLTLRVDRGSQFIARRFQEAAKTLNVALEYAGVQCPDDKPYIESFFGHYKTEEVYRTSYATLAEAQVGWQLYRIWYETERVHESLEYQTPHQSLTNGSGT